MTWKTSAVLGLMALVVVGCGEDQPKTRPPAPPTAPPVKPASISTAVEANNAFGLDLYRQIANSDGDANVFLSPYSIFSALCMTAEGAEGKTAAEMHTALHLPKDLLAVHKGMCGLTRRFLTQGQSASGQAAEKKLKKLRAKQAAIQNKLKGTRDWKARQKLAGKEQKVVDQINAVIKTTDPTELGIANAIWVEKTYPLEEAYLDVMARYYGSGTARPADFRGNAEAERAQINAWAEEQTRDRITGLLPPGSLDEYSRVALVNAIYFKSEWANPFEKKNTKTENFFLRDGGKTKVPLMSERDMTDLRYAAFNADGTFFDTPKEVRAISSLRDLEELDKEPPRYPVTNGFSMLEMPYRGGKLSMVIVAPNSLGGLAAVEQKLSGPAVAEWIGALRSRDVDVYLPRFRAETEYKLNDTLKGMGIAAAFRDPRKSDGANFGRMSAATDPANRIYISLVQHKAFVDVNEKGTEAAAATAVVGAIPMGVPVMEPFTPVFRADRPFLFIIRDIETGCLLFVGRIMKP